LKILNTKKVVALLLFAVGLLYGFVSAKNYNEDVNAFVKSVLMEDDYAEVMDIEPQATEQTIHSRDTYVNVGLRSKRVDNKVYFYIPHVIKVYNLSTEAWEADLVLPDIANAFEVDSQGAYVTHNRAVYFYPFDLSPRVFFGNLQTTGNEMTLVGGYLYVYSNQFHSFDITTGTEVDVESVWYRPRGSVGVPSQGKIISRNSGVSPCDIIQMLVDENGQIGVQNDSQYHGDYPCSDSVYIFPDESRVIDGAGIIYHANSLIYAGSLAGELDHVDFYGDLPIVLRGDTVYSYSNVMVETGQYTFGENKHAHAVFNEKVFAFDYETNSVGVEQIDIALIDPETPGDPVDPNGLSYNPDSIDYDGGDHIYLLDSNNLSVHVFNANTMSYDDSIALLEAPLFMAHSHDNNKLYLAYSDGRVTQVDLVTKIESGLFNSPQTPCGLASFDDKIFTCDPSGAWLSHFTYSSTGELISQEDWNYYSTEFKWNDVNRKMYHFRSSQSPSDLIWEDIDENGVIGQNMDSPYHGGSWYGPLCVKPSGSYVVIGSGTLYDAFTLEEVNYLSNVIKGCAWSKNQLFTLDNTTTTTDLQSWSPVFEVQPEAQFTGEPIDLIGLSSGVLIVIYSDNGIPQFAIHNDMIFNNSLE